MSEPVHFEPPAGSQPVDYPAHPFANIFPRLEGRDFDEFAASIRDKGLFDPVVLYRSQVLDGRNRLAACVRHGVKARFVTFEGSDGDALDFVIAHNLDRRHMDRTQRALAASKAAMLPAYRPPKTGPDNSADLRTLSQPEAAAKFKVSTRAVQQASRLRIHAIEEIGEAVAAGKLSLSAAEAISFAPAERQRDILSRMDPKEIKKAAKDIRRGEQVANRARRIAAIAGRVRPGTPAMPGKIYNVIYADPPWEHVVWGPTTGNEKGASNHYPTMSVKQILALPVPAMAAADCVLFLWATAPHLAQALATMAHWGFSYRSNLVWDKALQGTGYWSFVQHEHLLIGARGDIPPPLPGDQDRSLYREPRGAHSRKPDYFAALIERFYPDLPKIELFARQTRPGWDVWGNEVEGETDSSPTRDGTGSGPQAERPQNLGAEGSLDVPAGETEP